jgi:hypothetical protein
MRRSGGLSPDASLNTDNVPLTSFGHMIGDIIR